MIWGTGLLAAAAVAAFAGNSLIARAAIGSGLIEPGAFAALRLAAGAIVLLPWLKGWPELSDLRGALALLIYMLGFSFAYRDLPTATGALILFATVQATVILGGAAMGGQVAHRALLGLVIALGGIGWLLAPQASAPALAPTAIMAISGVAWGAYTLIGRTTKDGTAQTAHNFLLAAPLATPAILLDSTPPTAVGVGLAVVAGVVTSALGYALWSMVTPRLSLGLVAGAQLATPVVAGYAAAVFLSEPITTRLAVASLVVVTGIALTMTPPPGAVRARPAAVGHEAE